MRTEAYLLNTHDGHRASMTGLDIAEGKSAYWRGPRGRLCEAW
jgi:hypothetical protein